MNQLCFWKKTHCFWKIHHTNEKESKKWNKKNWWDFGKTLDNKIIKDKQYYTY